MSGKIQLALAGMLVMCLGNPELKPFDLSPRTDWKPEGCRPAVTTNPILDAPTGYSRTFHADTHNADEVAVAVPPVLELAWVAEEKMYVIEGPTFDEKGNLYFTPNASDEPVLLVSLAPEDGSRRWAIKGRNINGAGAPLVLNDPENPGEQIVYVGTYERALAVHTDGTILWDVRTGLPDPLPEDKSIGIHCFGLNYHPQLDALIGVPGDGHVYLLDRKTGKPLLAKPYRVPGEKSPPAKIAGIPVRNSLIQTILGGGIKVANYFAIDAHSGRIFVAATAPDEEDGKLDGISEDGAIYALEAKANNGSIGIEEKYHLSFAGGTSSTPSLNADGSRIYIGDSFGKLLAIDTAAGKQIWSVDIGEQIVASISVAADNGELYAPTLKYIVKVIDKGDHGEIAWRSDLNMYETRPGQKGVNLMGGTIAANGVVFHAGVGVNIFPLKVGVGLLDRETGHIRYFAEGREESAAAPCVGPDGSVYIGHLPVRRAIAHFLFPFSTAPITGGIGKYRAKALKPLARDALCAAQARAQNAERIRGECPASVDADLKQIQVLIRQSRNAIERASERGELTIDEARMIEDGLSPVSMELRPERLQADADSLAAICSELD
ncbi:MAG TPA: PQQ-binding-like beta-propeller repeat protein [bacterium]|nr:PQQ-binding-like beta-propeller repeat protein [bacterium]